MMFLKTLTQAFGVSGYEKEVREILSQEVQKYADDITVDALGNLIVYRKGTGPDKKKIMLSAHMDEIGLQVTKIEENGQIKVKGLGHHWINTLYMNRVHFRNGISGIVSSTVKIEDVKNDFTKLYVDIGAKSREDAQKYINVGDVACYIGDYIELKNDCFAAKALDDRIGCYIMMEALKKIENPLNDIWFVFSVQEEVGCRGAKVAAERIAPDIGIAIDITPAHDYPCDLEGSNSLGAGVAIKFSDTSVICDEYLVEKMIKCCEENNIKYQRDVIYVGGTDISSINLSNTGVKVAAMTIVARFPHGPNAMMNMNDVDAAIELLSKYININFVF
jgi:Cellulase M and related proteins